MSNKYFATVPVDQDVLFDWASKNELKLIGKPVSLPSCANTWEIDTQYNERIHLQMGALGQGRMDFMNDDQVIGLANIDKEATERTGITHFVVTPFCYERRPNMV